MCVAYYRKTCRIMSEEKQILFYSAKSLLPLVESIQSLCKPMWRWEKIRERIYILAGGGGVSGRKHSLFSGKILGVRGERVRHFS